MNRLIFRGETTVGEQVIGAKRPGTGTDIASQDFSLQNLFQWCKKLIVMYNEAFRDIATLSFLFLGKISIKLNHKKIYIFKKHWSRISISLKSVKCL